VTRTHGKLVSGRSARDGSLVWTIVTVPHIVMRAKRVFRRLEKSHAGGLHLWSSPETCRDLEWFLQRYPLEMSEPDQALLTALANQHRETIATLDDIMDAGYQPAPVDLVLPPRPYQLREKEIYLHTRGLLIADDVGLGKTVAAICSFTDPRTLPAVVVTLAHLPKQWEREIRKFAPGLKVHVIKRGQPYELPKAGTLLGAGAGGPDVVVINYHKLAGWSQVLGAYCKSIVFDEVQELRHPGSQKTQAARYIAEHVDFRLGLSATPIYNFGSEIFHVVDVLRPGVLGTYAEFITEWCGAERVSPAGSKSSSLKDPKAFGTWARENFVIVRTTRKDVGRELPVIRIPQHVEADTAALDDVKDTVAELARIILSRGAESFKGERLHASQEISALLRQATGIGKAPHVADFVRLLLESGEKVVLCGWHREVYRIWLDKLKDYRPVMYTGSETAAEKDRSLQTFMQQDDCRVFIMSLRSGAGLNGLEQVASVIVFGELDWSPGVHEQGIGRLARDGQQATVAAYFLVADEGSDPAVAEVNGLKREQVEGIRNPTEDFIEELQDDGAHAKRLAEHYLSKYRTSRTTERAADEAIA
jgi:superfamily II DNA or RNA helicase